MEVISVTISKDHIMSLCTKKSFDTISINIRDEAGYLVAFEHCKVIITSHFRRTKT